MPLIVTPIYLNESITDSQCKLVAIGHSYLKTIEHHLALKLNVSPCMRLYLHKYKILQIIVVEIRVHELLEIKMTIGYLDALLSTDAVF